MNVKHFILLTLVIGFVSELLHPNINTLVPVSLVSYVICIFFIVLAIYFYFCKKNQKKFTESTMRAAIVFLEYVIIIFIAYLRIADIIIASGPVPTVIAIIVTILFTVVILFWNKVK